MTVTSPAMHFRYFSLKKCNCLLTAFSKEREGIWYVFTISAAPHFLPGTCTSVWHHFPSARRTSFLVSGNVGQQGFAGIVFEVKTFCLSAPRDILPWPSLLSTPAGCFSYLPSPLDLSSLPRAGRIPLLLPLPGFPRVLGSEDSGY